MSFLSNLIKKAAPIVASVAPGTVVGTAAAVVSTAQAQQDASYRRKLAEEGQQKRNRQMAEIYGSGSNLSSVQAPMAGRTTASSGFGAGFGEFLGDVGRNIVSPISNIFSSAAPLFGRSVQQQPAVTTTRGFGAQESQGSGSIQAGMGGLVGSGLQQASRFLRSPTGQIGTGLLTGFGLSGMSSAPSGMRMTRKMKSQARTVLNIAGGDISLAADMLQVSEEFLIALLLKRFRNDGPVVTKAALRKTKTTVRRLKNMCDMYDSLRPAATRRRAPMKRAATTLISNK